MQKTQDEFDAALTAAVAAAQAIVGEKDARFDVTNRVALYTEATSPAYLRISASAGGSAMCYGFIRRKDGAILYAAGRRPFISKAGPDAPATVRGSIYDPTTWGCFGPYGVRTIR